MKEKKEDFIDKLVAWGVRFSILDKYTSFFQQLAKFVIVGVTNTAINWTILPSVSLHCRSQTRCLNLPSRAPSLSSFLLFSISGPVLHGSLILRIKTRRRLFVEFATFTFIAFLIFDEGMLAWLVSSDWHPMIAKVVTTAFGMVFNFITRKIFLEDDNKLKEKIHKSQPNT